MAIEIVDLAIKNGGSVHRFFVNVYQRVHFFLKICAVGSRWRQAASRLRKGGPLESAILGTTLTFYLEDTNKNKDPSIKCSLALVRNVYPRNPQKLLIKTLCVG